MLIRNFFRRTIKCFESVFSRQPIYLRILETAPSCDSRCCTTMHRRCKGSSSFRDLDELYTNEWAAKPEKASSTRPKKKGTKNKVKIKTCNTNVRNSDKKTLKIELGGDQRGNGREKAEVVQKLKEMKMIEERNSEHMIDIEETIYYYSLITSETYKEILDKFFVDLYGEFSVYRVQLGTVG